MTAEGPSFAARPPSSTHALGLLPLAALVLALSACQGSATSQLAPGAPKALPTSGPVSEAPGRLLYVTSEGFVTFDPSTMATKSLATLPARTFGGAPAVSPDGALVAYSLYSQSADVRTPGGADLYLMAADGSNARMALAHGPPGESLDEPAWAPGGRSLFFTSRSPRGAVRIERVEVNGSGRAVVVENAYSPTVSIDGKLAYLTTDSGSHTITLWVAEAAGTRPARLLGAPEFRFLAAPRFAPDGVRIAFAAVPGLDQLAAGRSSDAPTEPLSWLAGRVAHAHGVPWDVWLVHLDGSALQRLTELEEDSPVPAWSPDGGWIAFTGEMGLYLVDAEGTRLRRLAAAGAWGGLAWLPS